MKLMNGRYTKYFISVFFVTLFFQSPSYAYKFGYDGRDGRDGQTGRDGLSGRSAELVVTGQPVQLDLSGENGEDSHSDGERGQDASGCMSYPRNPEYNLEGADGGNGGNGGDGGAGGNGGDVTLFYSDISQLNKVKIISLGGAGGDGARSSAWGGFGCSCFESSWTIRTCRRRRDNTTECYYNTYYCFRGNNGRGGRHGQPGFSGREGHLTLIKGSSYPPAELKSVKGALHELLNRNFLLSENIWENKDGAISLLAPGSVLNNTYREFVSREAYNVSLVWAAKRNLAEFAAVEGSLELKTQDVAFTWPENIWMNVEKTALENSIEFKIAGAVKTEEVKNVNFEVSGIEEETTLTIKNGALYSDILQNSLHLQIWQDRVLSNKEVFNDDIAHTDLVVNGPDLMLKIGILKMREKNTFKAKKKIQWQALFTRAMGPSSTVIDSGKQKYSLK